MSEQITITSAGGIEVKLDLVAVGGRSYAFILDWHVRVLFALAWFVIAMLFISGGTLLQEAQVYNLGTVTLNLLVVPPILIYFLYHPVLEIAMHGRTPGKRIAGVRIVTKDGGTPSAGAILLRNVFRLIDSLPLLYVLGIFVCLFNKQHLRIGDMAAGTVLVYEERADKKRLNLIMSATGAHRLSPQQRELVAELLVRWRELEKDIRIRLARELLQKLGRPLATEDNRNLDRLSHRELHTLLQ